MSLEKKIKQTRPIPDSLKLALQIWYLHSRIYQYQMKYFSKYKLTPQQYNALRIIQGHHEKPCSLKDVKERLLDAHSDASRLIDRLVKNGWIVRTFDASDRRSCDLKLTKEGIKLMKKLSGIDQMFESLTEDIPRENIKVVLKTLDALIELTERWQEDVN